MRTVRPHPIGPWAVLAALAIGALPAIACTTGGAAPTPATERSSWVETVCPSHEAEEPIRCGTVQVWEDRQARAGRTIDLSVVVLGAAAADAAPDPLFILFGGPGQGAAEFAMGVAPAFARVRERRDVVFVDQRGTGASNPLDCRLPEDPAAAFGAVFPRQTIRECRRQLEARADLRLYTTSAFADDLDEVREALGYETVNLSGGSYGTRAALVFAKRHPSRTRSLILDGVFPVTRKAALPYARTADESLRALFADCAGDPACAAAYPDLEPRFEKFLADFTAPVEVEIEVDGEKGARVAVSRGDFGYGIRGIQYGPGIWRLPGQLLGAISNGDLTAVAQAYFGRSEAMWQAISIGQHLSVFCAEDLPYVDAAAVGPETEGTYLGRYLFDDYAEACKLWVRGEIPVDFHEPTRSEVPTLMFSGRRDPITPPSLAEEAARTLPNSLHVVFESGGHGYPGGQGGGCKGSIMDAFLERGSIEGIDTSCVDEIEPAGFELPSTSEAAG